MRTRRVLPWLVYAICALAVLEGLGYAGYRALDLQKQRRDDELVRRALWRMDTALTAVLAAESARPYFHYRAFHPADRAYSAMLGPIEPGEVLVPSPLLTEVPPFVRLHFEVNAQGEVTSPQAPRGNLRDLAEAEYVAADDVITAEALRLMLAELVRTKGEGLRPGGFDARGAVRSSRSGELSLAEESGPNTEGMDRAGQAFRPFQVPTQSLPSVQQRRSPDTERAFEPREVVLGPLESSWLDGDELVLLRDVRVGLTTLRQGVWLDWPSLRAWLLEQVEDIAPGATLAQAGSQARSLAVIPASLVYDPGSSILAELNSPLGLILVLTWIAALLAIVSIGVVLRLATNLAERRGRFVSAVTHELRTPMTSVRLYADLLASDAAGDDARRARFVETLRQESARLARIIENVLLFARLGRSGGSTEGSSTSIERVRGRINEDQRLALEDAGTSLVWSMSREAVERELAVEEETIARIIGNLIENSCKYASDVPDSRIEVRVDIREEMASFTVQDRGPGVPVSERRRIFDAFHRAARDIDRRDGLGLGLALARGLARQVGGDLTLEKSDAGARFMVLLPLAGSRSPQAR